MYTRAAPHVFYCTIYTHSAKVTGSPSFVLRTSRSISCPWGATFGPQKNFLRCLHDDGAVEGFFPLLPDTSAFHELVAWVTSVLARLLLPSSPQLHAPVVVALLLVTLTLLLLVLFPVYRPPAAEEVLLLLLAFPAAAAEASKAMEDLSCTSRSRYSIESNLDGGFDVDLARKLSRPPS